MNRKQQKTSHMIWSNFQCTNRFNGYCKEWLNLSMSYTTNLTNVTKTCLELKSLIIRPLQLDITTEERAPMTSLKGFQILFNVPLLSSYLQTILVWQNLELRMKKIRVRMTGRQAARLARWHVSSLCATCLTVLAQTRTENSRRPDLNQLNHKPQPPYSFLSIFNFA